MFPERTWFGSPVGWKDLGEEEFGVDEKSGREQRNYHIYCGDAVHVGKENGELFKFCNRCELKLKASLT